MLRSPIGELGHDRFVRRNGSLTALADGSIYPEVARCGDRHPLLFLLDFGCTRFRDRGIEQLVRFTRSLQSVSPGWSVERISALLTAPRIVDV